MTVTTPVPSGDHAARGGPGGSGVADALAELLASLPAGSVVSDPDLLVRVTRDEAAWAPASAPAAAAFPTTTEQVQTLVALAARHRVPVVARGAGTGLSGGANASPGSIVCCTERMREIVAIDRANQTAVVQPGVVNDHLKAACAEVGLWYPPDPASAPWSTIGGNVATNAGGLCCLKYGVTRDYVLGMEAVVGDGRVVRLGRRTSKGVAGYDLCGLMVGSEGTLGIITEVTLRLRPAPTGIARTVVGFFDRLEDAGAAVAAVTAAGILPLALELMDRRSLRAVDDWRHMGLDLDAAVLLLARSDTPGEGGEEEAAAIVSCFEGAGASWAALSSDAEEAEALFAARRLVYPALERLGAVLTEDVCVPRSALPAMLSAIDAIGERHGLLIATVAHAGDGNVHPNLITPHGDAEARARAFAAFDELLDTAIGLGGTVTGEHGIGTLKMAGMRREQSADVYEMQQALKAALDPLGIFNPGKVVGALPVIG